MSLKFWITVCVLIGSTIGGFIPALWGDFSLFSGAGIIGSFIGGIIGIWVGYVIYNNYFNDSNYFR